MPFENVRAKRLATEATARKRKKEHETRKQKEKQIIFSKVQKDHEVLMNNLNEINGVALFQLLREFSKASGSANPIIEAKYLFFNFEDDNLRSFKLDNYDFISADKPEELKLVFMKILMSNDVTKFYRFIANMRRPGGALFFFTQGGFLKKKEAIGEIYINSLSFQLLHHTVDNGEYSNNCYYGVRIEINPEGVFVNKLRCDSLRDVQKILTKIGLEENYAMLRST